MKQRRTARAAIPAVDEPAVRRPEEADRPLVWPAPVRCRFGIELPAWNYLPPRDDHDDSSAQMATQIWQILSLGFADLHPTIERHPPGILALDVEAAYLGAAPGEIPEYEDSKLGGRLCDLLAGTIRSEARDGRPIDVLNEPERGFVRVSARFASDFDLTNVDLTYDFIYNRIVDRLDQDPPPAPIEFPTPADMLRAAASRLPEDLEERASALAAIHHDYRGAMAPLLQPILNARLGRAAGSKSSLDEKRALAKDTNEYLRTYGLAIRCEVADRDNSSSPVRVYPAFLVADTPRNSDAFGRFRLEYQGEDGKAKRQTLPSEAEAIQLIVATSDSTTPLLPQPPATFAGRLAPRAGRPR